jgi:hypothetical protein
MILEFPAGSQPGEELRDYICDDVRIESLSTRWKLQRREGRKYYFLETEIEVFTRKSHDRLVDVTVELVGDGKVLLRYMIPTIDAEEEEHRKATGRSERISADQFKRTTDLDGLIRRFTVQVKDN